MLSHTSNSGEKACPTEFVSSVWQKLLSTRNAFFLVASHRISLLQLSLLESNLEDSQKQWAAYQKALQKVTGVLTETEYTLHRYNLATGDIQALSNQIQQLKVRFRKHSQV